MELMVTQRTNASRQLMTLQFQSTLLEKIKEAQSGDPKIQELEIKWRLDLGRICRSMEIGHSILVTESVYRNELFDKKFYLKLITLHIPYIQEERRCTKT